MTSLMISTTNAMDEEAYRRVNAAADAESPHEVTSTTWLVIAERFAAQAKNAWIWRTSYASEVAILVAASGIALERASALLATHWGD